MYVPTGLPAMVRRRSNRQNGVGLDVQYHDNYDMGILGKIVKIFTRDLPELKYVNSSMCNLVHMYGVVLSKFWNAEDEVHMLIIQLSGGGGRYYVAEFEVEWVNDGDPSIFYQINEQTYELNEHINVSTSSSSDYCNLADMSYVPSTNGFEEERLEREKLTPTS